MANENPHQAPSTTDVPPFPNVLAAVPPSLDATERLNADPPDTAPQWEPEDGDFS